MSRLHHTVVFYPSDTRIQPVMLTEELSPTHPEYHDQLITESVKIEVLQTGSGLTLSDQNYGQLSAIVTSTGQQKQVGEDVNRENTEKVSGRSINCGRALMGVFDDLKSEIIKSDPRTSRACKVPKEECPKPRQKSASSSPQQTRKCSPSVGSRRRREKANEREKQRIMVLKRAMNVLKDCIPAARQKTKITKLEILNLAREYISSLSLQLADCSVEESGRDCECGSCESRFLNTEDCFLSCNDSQ